MSSVNDVGRLNDLIAKWKAYRAVYPEPERYEKLRIDLYQARNPGWNGSPPLSAWPSFLIDPDDAVMAAVEHYFLCRADRKSVV